MSERLRSLREGTTGCLLMLVFVFGPVVLGFLGIAVVNLLGGENHPGDNRPQPISTSRCDSAYPDFCVPSPPPDLNCADVGRSNFTVRAVDPHGFDGYDNDGIGCES